MDGLDYAGELDANAFVGQGRFGEKRIGAGGKVKVTRVVDVVIGLFEAGPAEVGFGELGLSGYDYGNSLVLGCT
jgi:hypothetical protein